MPARFNIHKTQVGFNDVWYVIASGLPNGTGGFLYPDLEIHPYRTHLDLSNGHVSSAWCYFSSREDCQFAINKFIKKGGASVCDISKKKPQLVNEIITVMSDFHKSGKDYTAHDVTKEVRVRLGPSNKVEHRDIRDVVHELHRQGGHWYVGGYTAAPDTAINAMNPPIKYSAASPLVPSAQNSPAPAPSQSTWTTTAKFVGIVRS